MEKFEKLKAMLATARAKKIIYIVCAVVLVAWVLYRFVMIALEQRQFVYNAARMMATDGIPVEVLEMKKQTGILFEPVAVKNNRAMVSTARATLLKAGQKIGEGEIVSVSGNIDLDTGMHVVRTRGTSDGLQNAEYRANGYFVPVYAISNGSVFVVEDGAAAARAVKIARQDADTALITQGLTDGDMVILSKVSAGDKVQIKNK